MTTDLKGKMMNAANQQLLADIQALEGFAHARGLHVTAHTLNRAKNALGWEMAGDIEQARKASRDERPER